MRALGAKGLTQQEVADELNVSRSTVCRAEALMNNGGNGNGSCCNNSKLGEFDSLAGSGATYLGTDNFRIRRLGENGARLHLPVNGKTYRTRDEYVAVDINLDLLKEAIEKM